METMLTILLDKSKFSEEEFEKQIEIPIIPITNTVHDRQFIKFLKRSVDIFLGTILAMLILPWMLPLIAILIKLDSRGPVFFVQKRTGLNKKSFSCLKFRTMVVNNQADRLEVQPNDKRITKLGHFLRKYHFDEAPQILNVIFGNMSLVGPRPHMLRHTVLYSRIVKDYHVRHRVKPGITGLAQMRGYHGTIKDRNDLYNRFYSDIEYIENWSVWGDMTIFFRTVLKIIKSFNG
jgi:putative colanic acid biosysnthesis UDP-glucose lipid carrier transferase